ncbi:TPA_asm: hypothetical protein [ssRNA phage Gerhypos.2_38]|jgi:hypothetical protein|uniref:Uncharacterized protein n=2 Tax=Norzivirales TaxID=2842247 RepID=A0A8S5KZK4_9VIRU|nr:hypothetical protein QII30_gp1 [ssRNA phage Gerhypos.2_38]QDH89635.1 MAG: hypothetical protein H2Bulk3671_000001 [Leviviridae sp.]DAD50509.1 TPA_asm: hypothetical protein [ssRNA phage Gerhypos.2_38]
MVQSTFYGSSDAFGTASLVSDETLNGILKKIEAELNPSNRDLLKQVVKLAVRLYILHSLKVNSPERLKDMIDSLISETLGHTRVV